MAAKKSKHACACKWWKWTGNASGGNPRGVSQRFKPSEARRLQDDEK